MTTEALEKTLDVDLRAAITGFRYAAQAMITAGIGGRLSSIASPAGDKPSNNFRDAVQLVSTPMRSVPAGHVIIRRRFVGINASDINHTSGRYHSRKSAAAAALPYDAGFESVGVVVEAASDAGIAVGSAAATMDAGFSEYALVQNRRVLPVPCPAPRVVAGC
eukprot:GHUV01012458.1.p1 GENE.GHUV01012458.1~~GHUV01012458.1.p1  ORF type:complete len:163 (+),score=41.06 GHUV01012458.1:233-721(+)